MSEKRDALREIEEPLFRAKGAAAAVHCVARQEGLDWPLRAALEQRAETARSGK